MADGSKLPSVRFVLREVRIGNQSARNVVASVSPARGEPLLGQSFLSKLPPWTIDYRRNTLVVNETAPPSSTAGVDPPFTTPPTPQLGYGGFGAFAHDERSGRYGFSWNEADQPHAEYAALRGCGGGDCKVVFRVGPRQCAAIALTDDGKVWAGSTRPTKAAAELAALQGCQKRTLAQCRLRGAVCNS
jgi:hypothetical protein